MRSCCSLSCNPPAPLPDLKVCNKRNLLVLGCRSNPLHGTFVQQSNIMINSHWVIKCVLFYQWLVYHMLFHLIVKEGICLQSDVLTLWPKVTPQINPIGIIRNLMITFLLSIKKIFKCFVVIRSYRKGPIWLLCDIVIFWFMFTMQTHSR